MFKSTTYKKKKLGRTTTARGARPQLTDPTVRVTNVRREHPVRFVKTIDYNRTINYGVGTTPAQAFIFDPSGTNGNTGVGLTPVGLTDWASLTALYDQYKVNWIKMTFTWTNSGGGTCPLYIRYNYDPDVTVPTFAGMAQLANLTEKSFTNVSPKFTYIFKPVEMALVDNFTSGIATEGRAPREHQWTDVTYPVELWGCQLMTNFALVAGMNLFFEIEYDVSFKSSR